jgi:dTDP-glucose 4,6-dehydratase
MKILVTGGAGFIGSNFVRMFDQGTFPELKSVTILDKLTYAGNLLNLESLQSKSKVTFIKGDICDPFLVQELIRNNDAVINFAAESHVDRSIFMASEFVKTNINGVQNLLETILRLKNDVRLLQVSTDEVYGSINEGSWNEESPLLPNSPYSASKAGGELIARAYNRTHDLDVVVTRASNNYGPFHFPEKIIPLFITNLLENKRLPIYGTGLQSRDWLHVDDHCLGIYKVLISGVKGETYNIGGGKELTNLNLTSLILESMGEKFSTIDFIEDRKGHDFRYSIDWTKIRRELRYEPQVEFEDGLVKTIAWYRANTKWWKPLKHKGRL